MTRRAVGRVLTTLLATAVVGTAAGPAAAAPAGTEGRTGYADATFDGIDDSTGRTVHSVFSVFDPQDQAPFGTTDFFVGEDAGIVYECVTDQRTPATISGLDFAGAAGVLRVDCHSPMGLPSRSGYAVVGVLWRGEGPVEHLVFPREECTEYLDVRHARVVGAVLLAVPGVAVTTLTPHDHPADEIRQQRVVCA
ncbi:hypothetical protein E4P41_02120 [Geodermatophilus sp. DF01-2]|uniref:hypothetical protein n=1 Tax=Geodermatophilus sp. DF01-2 TaxID=2559610 RepID=UPI0010737074|nr:hypothetical protein [Geodermatophilus sp. DF01_2]TFV64362.1 hypothetical protein E4P41_02120 [Geodermatophilus sp. DF01_2]